MEEYKIENTSIRFIIRRKKYIHILHKIVGIISIIIICTHFLCGH